MSTKKKKSYHKIVTRYRGSNGKLHTRTEYSNSFSGSIDKLKFPNVGETISLYSLNKHNEFVLMQKSKGVLMRQTKRKTAKRSR